MTGVPPVSAEAVREVRLALVCFGGVSLAIYMHGTTREIHKLVRASNAYEQSQRDNPFTAEGERAEAAYWRLLRQLHQRDGVRTRVVVDVVSGTSAGGINGVCLAKAVAHDASQDALRDLWMEEGDIGKLWASPGPLQRLPWQVRATFWAANSLRDLRAATPPLRGDRMCRLLYDALAGMSRSEGGSTLVPDGLSLDLFVTLTDLRGYRRFVRIKDRLIDDTTHRAVMRFRYDATGADNDTRRDDFSADHTAALAFAARATSSFPGAFPAIGLPSFRRDLGGDGQRPLDRDVLVGFLPAYRPPYDDPESAWFIDGGVLDNKPFGHAIGAIVAKPASTEVRRWLVYLEPDPAGAPVPQGGAENDGPAGRTQPGLLATVIPALSGIPRSEPILDELRHVRDFNERIVDVNRLVAPQMRQLSTALSRLTDLLGGDRPPTREQISAAMHQVHEQAREDGGSGYVTYLRLKMRAIQHSLAAALALAYAYPPESSQAAFVRAVIGEWQDRSFHADPGSAESLRYLNRNDVPYRIRRLRFVVQGVNDLYPNPAVDRHHLDQAKRELYLAIDQLTAVLAPAAVRAAGGPAGDRLFADRALADWLAEDPDPVQFSREHDDEITDLMTRVGDYLEGQLDGSSVTILHRFDDLSRDWEPELRRTLLHRFVGFPLWDTTIFTLLSLTDIQQFSAIRIARFSPDGASRLSAAGSGKLQGTGIHHFGAFFSRKARENDYLWGRLDGAEQLLGLLGDVPPAATDDVLDAILDEEAADLRTAASRIKQLQHDLRGPGARGGAAAG